MSDVELFAPHDFHPSAGATGDPLDEYIAKMPGVQAELQAKARAAEPIAKALLAAHRFEGRAHIEVGKQALDWHLYLVDDGPHPNAMAIELGRAPAIYEDGSTDKGMTGLYILHDAFELAHKQAHRNRRMRGQNPARRGRKGR